MSLRKKLQTTIAILTFVALGLASVTLWATIQWQKSERGLREHYLRSLLLQEVRAGTFRAFKEVPDALSGDVHKARTEFSALLAETEKDFRAWADLAHTELEQQQVQEVRGAYDVMVQNARQFFELVTAKRLREAYKMMEEQLEDVDFEQFEVFSARAVESDNEYRRHIEKDSERIRELAQMALVTASVVTVGLVALLGFYFISGLFRPLQEVEKALSALGSGDLQQRIPEASAFKPASVRAEDELSTLVHAFNSTVDALSRTTVSKAYLDSIIESMADALVVAAPDGTIRTANPASSALFGASREEIIGKPIAEFITVCDLGGHERIHELETTIRTRAGREIPVSLSRSVMRGENGMVLGIACVAQDITERKRAEEQIRAALEEKEVLFKEINHRVKNNLQVIHSLLNLQTRQIADPKGREVLIESRNRIQAMALIHEMLYRSETPARIDFGEYFLSLTEYLMSSYGAGARHIRVACKVAPISSSLDTAIPCGLIINELVTNSLKHAFPGGAAGEIVVDLRDLPDHYYCLSVRDNGVGLPADLRIEETRSLGLRLVRTLTEQLGGRLAVESNGGARFEIQFPAQHEP